MAKTDLKTFSALLRRHRLAAELTQEELAERAGLSVRGVSDLERGVNRVPYVATILRLGEALRLSDEQRAELESSVSRRRGPSTERPVLQFPEQQTSLLGRERDEASAVHLLRWEGRRLLTLTGPGGVGKTRLAIQVAATMAADFEGGAVFVALEEVVDAGGVASAIASSISLRDEPRQSTHDSLVRYLSDREILLVLDGFEHLMDAAPLPAQLLKSCPRLKILITSRAPLHLRGEQEMDVKALPVPSADDPTDLANLGHYASIALFVQRASKVKPEFAMTRETAPVLAEICRRVDGLPLAIELAAARIKLLSPQALLLRLERRLNVLIGGPRDSQPRQQTMRDTIAWSYDLLPEEQKSLFRRVSVFNAPFSIEAAGNVLSWGAGCSTNPADDLALLVDCSLLSVEEGAGEPRFSMLETVREYGLELLDSRGESNDVRKSLAEYCMGLAEAAEAELHGASQAIWMTRLEEEHATILLSLRWARESSSRLFTGFRIAGALWRFWYSRGHLSEGRRQLEELLVTAGESDSLPLPLIAKVLRGAAVLAATQGDYSRAAILSEKGLGIYRQIADVRGEAAMLVILGTTSYFAGDYGAARNRYEESLALFQGAGDTPSISVALNNLANVAKEEGRNAESIALYEDSLAIKRQLGDSRGIAIALNNLGTMALAQGEYKRAATFGEEALNLLRQLGDKDVTAALDTVARASLQGGDCQRAAELYQEGLAVSHAAGDRELIAFCLEGTGRVAAAQGKMERAGTLYGAANALRMTVGAPLSPAEQSQHAVSLGTARTGLGAEMFARAWDRGVDMTLEEAIAFAADSDEFEGMNVS